MRAVQFSAHGGPDVLQFLELTTPQPGAGEVLIKVSAAGVNYADIYQRRGTSKRPIPLPYVPGYEVVGTVAALGAGVTDVPVGQRVMALLPSGGYAEYALAPAAQLFALPAGLGAAEATALLS